MNRMFIAIVVLVVMLPVAGTSSDYWPMEDGLVWRYGSISDWGHEVTMNCNTNGCSRGRSWTFPDFSARSTVSYQESGNGDVLVTRTSFSDSRQLDPSQVHFDPPLVFLDLPLEVGKSWYTIAPPYGIVCEVLREESLTVPLGTFDVFVVSVIDLMNFTRLSGEYYLNRELGALNNDGNLLAGFSGPVGIETSSWGTLKALFR